jgi:hypothetical protein
VIDIFLALMRNAQQENEENVRRSQTAANLAPEGSQSGNILLDMVGGGMSKAPGTNLVEPSATAAGSSTPTPTPPIGEATGVPGMAGQVGEIMKTRMGATAPGSMMRDIMNPNVSGMQTALNMVDRNTGGQMAQMPQMPAAPGYTPPMSTAPGQGIEAILARSQQRANLFNYGY